MVVSIIDKINKNKSFRIFNLVTFFSFLSFFILLVIAKLKTAKRGVNKTLSYTMHYKLKIYGAANENPFSFALEG